MFDKYEIRKKFTNERNRTSFVDDEVADHIVKKSEEPITPWLFDLGQYCPTRPDGEDEDTFKTHTNILRLQNSKLHKDTKAIKGSKYYFGLAVD